MLPIEDDSVFGDDTDWREVMDKIGMSRPTGTHYITFTLHRYASTHNSDVTRDRIPKITLSPVENFTHFFALL